jgi:hypothetical protein
MSLVSRIEALATRIGEECKLIWADVDNKADAAHTHSDLHNHINKTDLDNYDPTKFASSTHDHDSTYEPAFSKNSAFNKNFGTASGAVCEGNDSRLSDNRTPTDTSVSYAKVASDLTDRATDNDGSWDFNANGIIDAAISSNTTVSFSNLKQNKVLKIKIVITNSAEITLPSYCTILEGSAEASGNNGTYFLYFDCWKDTSGSEEVLVTISKAPS